MDKPTVENVYLEHHNSAVCVNGHTIIEDKHVEKMIDALIAINMSKSARQVMGSVARTKMIEALKEAGVEL